MDDAELIKRATEGEVIGGGLKQIQLLVAEVKKWREIAFLRGHAIKQIHNQTDRIWMVEHAGAESREELIKHAQHEQQVSFDHSFYRETTRG